VTKHTPGPWFADMYWRNAVYAPSRYSSDGTEAICILPIKETFSERDANANLIAQAPAMYALIRETRYAITHSVMVNTANPDDLLGQVLLKCLDIQSVIEQGEA